MSNPLHVLVVDDEPRIRTLLRRYLAEEGYKVSDAGDGAAMRNILEREAIDLVLLDLMMPGEDGLTLARLIRQQSQIPIIMLTGKSDLIDRVVGLETGADDYITKPFELREVLARIRTVMRRAGPRNAAAASSSAAGEMASEILVFEGWRFDLLRRELRRQTGEIVPLTAGEFELLCAFARHPNRVLNRDQLIDLVKGRDWAAYDRGVDTQVMRLRKKIEADPGSPSLIKTVRGAGYVFAAAVKVG
ncbi:MAG TPA: response regulator [Methylocella sp.]|nr:response regulator [Methylocella sp.]